jgi:hypothetical protein
MMTTPRKVALALVGVGVALLVAWTYRTRPRPTRPIDAVPPDAFVAIEVDVSALRKSGALRAIFGDKNEQSLTQVCGFDPVDRMQDLVFTVPEGGDGAFGVAVQADITQDDLVRCANEIVQAHGGDPTSDVASYGSYAIITPKSTSAESTKPARSLGYHAGSPILVGPKAWLERMIDALDAASEGRGGAGEHLALRTKLSNEITPAPTFLLTASVLLEKSVREKLKAEMAAEVGPGEDSGTSMMLGVLGMSGGALGMFERGEEVRAVVDLKCEEERQCVEVERLIAKVRGEWAKMDALRAFGLGTVLDHLEVDHHGTELQVRAGAPTSDIVRWAKIFLDSKPLVGASTSIGAVVPSAPAAVASDVPTQTVRITVPEGVKPGQPFTVQIPSPVPGGSALSVRPLTATVPPPTASGGPPGTMPPKSPSHPPP